MLHSDAGLMLGEIYASGPLNGLRLTNQYDALLRRTNVSILDPSSQTLSATAYTYDDASRLDTVSSGTNSASYSYLANSPFVENITFQNNGTTRMTTTRSYDSLNRLTSIVSSTNGTALASFTYGLNNVNQRTNITTVDDSRWVYTYDNLGQVTSGKKVWANGTNVAGMNFDYAFDDIGNRKQTKSGQDLITGAQHTANYWNNLLNQIIWRDVPSFAGMSGLAATNATVTVDNRRAVRQTNYWWAEAWLTNSAAPAWQSVVTVGVISNASGPDTLTSVTGNVFAAKSPEQFKYDMDGNRTNDGRFSIVWDAENRALSFTRVSGAPAGSKVKLDCAYDSQWRRTQKIVSTWNGSAYAAQSTNKFVYDGWNLTAILDATNGLDRTFTWALDLSGTMQGAGGVGGLISMTVYRGTNAGTYFPVADGNGNVTAYVNAASGVVAAEFEHGPFGELLRATGPLARECAFLFSTKFYDWETGLYYYGYRYYDPSTGMWLSKDPIEERGGLNFYAFVCNKPANTIDLLGLLYMPYPYPHDISDTPSPDACRSCPYNPPHLYLPNFEPVELVYRQTGIIPKWSVLSGGDENGAVWTATGPIFWTPAAIGIYGSTEISRWSTTTRVVPCSGRGKCYCVTAVTMIDVKSWAVEDSFKAYDFLEKKATTFRELEESHQKVIKTWADAFAMYASQNTGKCLPKNKADCRATLLKLASKLGRAVAGREAYYNDLMRQGLNAENYDRAVKVVKELELQFKTQEKACDDL